MMLIYSRERNGDRLYDIKPFDVKLQFFQYYVIEATEIGQASVTCNSGKILQCRRFQFTRENELVVVSGEACKSFNAFSDNDSHLMREISN